MIIDLGRSYYHRDLVGSTRSVGSAHPQTHLWDNGTDAVQELERMLRVRAAALERFGERAIRSGRPLVTPEEALVPLYLHHRYQTEAAVKSVGGVFYNYALRGEQASNTSACSRPDSARRSTRFSARSSRRH